VCERAQDAGTGDERESIEGGGTASPNSGFGQGERRSGALRARARLASAPLDREQAKSAAHGLFALMDRHLATRSFLASDAPTIADVAMYSYTDRAPEGGVLLDPYPNVVAWLRRIEALPAFVPMQRAGGA
jgi:glutathione S-transferase